MKAHQCIPSTPPTCCPWASNDGWFYPSRDQEMTFLSSQTCADQNYQTYSSRVGVSEADAWLSDRNSGLGGRAGHHFSLRCDSGQVPFSLCVLVSLNLQWPSPKITTNSLSLPSLWKACVIPSGWLCNICLFPSVVNFQKQNFDLLSTSLQPVQET